MDITAVLTKSFGTLFSTYWWLIPLLFLITIFKTPFMKVFPAAKKHTSLYTF